MHSIETKINYYESLQKYICPKWEYMLFYSSSFFQIIIKHLKTEDNFVHPK